MWVLLVLANILIIDDEASIRELIADVLKDEGFTTAEARNAAQALEYLETAKAPKVIILDIWLEGSHMDGVGMLKMIRASHPSIPIIMISGHGNIEMAVKTIRLGAYDFIEKPFKAEKLTVLVKRAIESSVLTAQNLNLKKNVNLGGEFWGNSKYIQVLRNAAMLAAPTISRIFITGEIGTGKEVIARMIHNKSKRHNLPFMILQAGNISEAQIEDQLFGTQATSQGFLEICDGGTLFIDEITEMPLATQNKFLNFLQQGSFRRIGSNVLIKSDVRIIAASSKKLEDGNLNLNQSLFYRLNVVPLYIPPLRERKDDIKVIAEKAIQLHAIAQGRKIHISDDAYNVMYNYDWPGNVRQLLNTVEWLMIMSQNSNKEIMAADLPQAIIDSVQKKHANLNPVSSEIIGKQLKQARVLFEKEYLAAQLNRFDGNISKTANFIGMDRTALHRKIKSLGITLETTE